MEENNLESNSTAFSIVNTLYKPNLKVFVYLKFEIKIGIRLLFHRAHKVKCKKTSTSDFIRLNN